MKKIRLSTRLPALLISAIFIFPPVDSASQDEVISAVRQWEEALLDRDIDDAMSMVSEDFKGQQGEGKAEHRQAIKQLLETGFLDDATIDSNDARITLVDGRATVFPIRVKTEKEEHGGMLIRLTLENEEAGWRIVSLDGEPIPVTDRIDQYMHGKETEPPSPLRVIKRQDVHVHIRDHFVLPRPENGMVDVPLNTSFFIVLATGDDMDAISKNSICVELKPKNSDTLHLLKPNQTFATGYSGEIKDIDYFKGRRQDRFGKNAVGIYINGSTELEPNTEYTIRVGAESRRGASIPESEKTWSFTTQDKPDTHKIKYELNVESVNPLHWEGAFFPGFVKASFNSAKKFDPGWDLMTEAQKDYPIAWTLQRDFWLTGFQQVENPLRLLPNVVRELETRRVTSMTRQKDGILLSVEDFFGHEQYGIESNRPVSTDYHRGDTVQISDPENNINTRVLATDDAAGTVLVEGFDDPSEGWEIEYRHALPEEENPDAPGLFPPGGTHLRKMDPPGTPHYYWGRVKNEWDIAVKKYGRTLIPGFNDAPGDIAIEASPNRRAKNYAQLHDVVHTMTSYLIERYGDLALEWRWSIFNEPNLHSDFRDNWPATLKFYDYTADAILRAFEDHGYNSSKVMVGGLEWGGAFGLNWRLNEFLAHASPAAKNSADRRLNAAYADALLDGKRSQRVEALCNDNDGRGAPLDWISIHTYHGSKTAAEMLIKAKSIALEIDSSYYADLWVNSYESAPYWVTDPDPGAKAVYLGSGYYTTWMADYVRRLLRKGQEDNRYAFGELIHTIQPWPLRNFNAIIAIAREIHMEEGTVMVPTPIFNFTNLLSTMTDTYWVFPEERIGGHVVSGFGSPDENGDLRLLFYSHNKRDMQSRSNIDFEITLNLNELTQRKANVTEYRFDSKHNSYHEQAAEFAKRPDSAYKPALFTEEEVAGIKELAELRPTKTTTHTIENDGSLDMTVAVSGNGINFFIIEFE
jgi:hypothetical protein